MTAPEIKKKSIPTYETNEFTATVVKVGNYKEVKVNHLAYFHNEMENFREGDQVGFVITNVKKRLRSLSQNSYMHCYFTLIAKMTDASMQDIKHWAKGKCLSNGITEVFGDKIRKVKDTHRLTIGEMIEFLARVEVESGYPMPDARPFNLPITHEEFRQLKENEISKYKKIKSDLKHFLTQ
jgi:hypothetical protein